MEFNFFMPVRTVSGKNAVALNSALLKTLGNRCMIVTGGTSARVSGALEDVQAALKKEGIAYELFDKIGPNPLISACHTAGEQARSFGAEFIIGIGGGSPLDAAKAVAIYAPNANLEPVEIYKRKYDNSPLPLALVGTTAGTGSEVTGVSVLTVDESGRKKSIVGEDCYAKVAYADPKYTYTVPYDITVSTGLDALSHGVEAWFTPKCVGISKCFAVKGISMLWTALQPLRNTRELPSRAVRDELYYGSLYTGLAINACGTAFPHPLGYILTENYGMPHGKACAAFLVPFLTRAYKYEQQKFFELFTMLKTDPDAMDKIVTELIGLPKIHMTSVQAAKYAERWVAEAPKNFDSSPGGLAAKDAQELLMGV